MGALATCLLMTWAVVAQAGQIRNVDQAGVSLRVVAGSIQRHPNGLVESAQLPGETELAGIRVAGAPEKVGFYSSGRLRWGTLAAEAELDGYRLATGTRFELFDRELDDDRRAHLRHATLASPQALEGIRLPAGTAFYRNSRGHVLQAYLAAPTRIHGVRVGGPTPKSKEIQFFRSEPKVSAIALGDQRLRKVPIPDGSRVYFDSAGRLRAIDPTRPITIRGRVLEREIQLGPDGAVLEGWLVGGEEGAGLPCSSLHPTRFHPNGRVADCRVAEDPDGPRAQGLRLVVNSPLHAYSNGKLASVFLYGPQAIQGLEVVSRSGLLAACPDPGACEGGTPVRFHANGKLAAGLLARSQQVRGMDLRGLASSTRGGDDGCARVTLFANGRLERVHLEKDQTIDELPLAADRSDGTCCPVTFYEGGQLESACLSAEHAWGRVALLAGTAFRLHPDGRLAEGVLAAPWKIAGVGLPPFVPVSLRRSGRPVLERSPEGYRIGRLVIPTGSAMLPDRQGRVRAVVLSADLTVRRLPAARGDALLLDTSGGLTAIVLNSRREIGAGSFPPHSRLAFDQLGVIQQVRLVSPARIQGIPCAAFDPILLHPSGRLKRARLAEPLSLGERRLAAGDVLELYADGRPVTGVLDQRTRFGERTLQPGDLVEQVHPEGGLRVVVFGSARLVDGHLCRAGVETHFHANGRLKRCWLVKPAQVQGLLVRDQMELSPTGRLERAFLARVQQLQGVEFAADTVALYPDGRVRWGRLSKEQRIGGRTYPALSLVRFNRAGEVKRAEPFAPPGGF